VLDEWGTAPGAANDVRRLCKSYEALPTDVPRRMFLDAALLLHGRPRSHLTTLWAAQLLQDESHSGDGMVLRSTGWRSRGKSLFDGSRQQRSVQDAQRCRTAADGALLNLVQWSFVVLDGSGVNSGGDACSNDPSAIKRCYASTS
jgi:hypothetical protein